MTGGARFCRFREDGGAVVRARGSWGAGEAAVRSPGAAMATPDQKSPNVLLQNLCCRILGRSEGTRGGAEGSGGWTP